MPNFATGGYADILSARIEQNGGQLTLIIETRDDIPATFPQPSETLTFLWLLDIDNDAATGQSHGLLGSEFNVRAVVGQDEGGGFVDVTGSLPGGGGGLPVEIEANRIQITVWLSEIATPQAIFHWRCDSFHIADGVWVTGNYETAVADATPLPYTPPAHVRVTTPLLMLSLSGPTTGAIGVELFDAAGNILPNDGHLFAFHSTNEASASVDADGLVTAQAVPIQHWETPYVEVWADGVMADNAAFVRVTSTDLGAIHQAYAGNRIAYYLPATIEGVDLEALLEQYQLVEATDRAYTAQERGVGGVYVGGGLQYLVLDVADDPNTTPCGASGNPVRLGWEFGKPQHNSCFIINDPSNRTPQWFVIFHEIGHNMVSSCNAFNMFLWSPSPDHNFAYSEGMASLSALWAWQAMMECSGGLTQSTLEDLDSHFQNSASSFRQSLADYCAAGAQYATIDPNIVDGILLAMFDRYGPKVWFDLFSSFLPAPDPLPYAMDTMEKQATWFVAAISASAGTDLRNEFASSYGFPIDNDAWPVIYDLVQSRVAARQWQPHVAADSDCDDDVDESDFQTFKSCASGSAVPYPEGCAAWDFDRDDDVDIDDFGVFQRCYNGANNLPSPNCGDQHAESPTLR